MSDLDLRVLGKGRASTVAFLADGDRRMFRWPVYSLCAAAVALPPFVASPFIVELACQFLLASIGALSLMILTGIAGQISLGHAGLLAAGAFTTGILFREFSAPFWITLPASALAGAALGFVFGLPSLRVRGVYLAVSTLALHFVVLYLGAEYEVKRGYSSGILIDPPIVFGYEIYGGRAWYFVLLAALSLAYLLYRRLLHARTGRAWLALHAHPTVASALGINIARFKLLAFVFSSSMTAVAGALFAYYRGFVSVEAFSIFVSIQYIAMVIIGGMGSLVGAICGAFFVVLIPYAIEAAMELLPGADAYAGSVFAVNYAAFGAIMIAFLLFKPTGLAGMWEDLKTQFGRRP